MDVEFFGERPNARDLKGNERNRGQRPWLLSAEGTPMPKLVLQLSEVWVVGRKESVRVYACCVMLRTFLGLTLYLYIDGSPTDLFLNGGSWWWSPIGPYLAMVVGGGRVPLDGFPFLLLTWQPDKDISFLLSVAHPIWKHGYTWLTPSPRTEIRSSHEMDVSWHCCRDTRKASIIAELNITGTVTELALLPSCTWMALLLSWHYYRAA